MFFVCLLNSDLFAVAPKQFRLSGIRAVDSVRKKGLSMDPMMISSVLHINREYRLSWQLEKLRAHLLANPPRGRRPMLRFAEPGFAASESEVKLLKGIDRITASALYCDIYPLPWDFYSELETMAARGEYYATHALLAAVILQQKKCSVDRDRLTGIQQGLERTVAKIAGSQQPLNDLRIEAVLMLLLAGGRDAIRAEWIAEIYLAQSPDGSYFRNDHSTVLAGWAMLEYARLQGGER